MCFYWRMANITGLLNTMNALSVIDNLKRKLTDETHDFSYVNE